jgi:hypothetical protein
VLSVTVQTTEYVEVDALRPVLTRTHRPADAELLALLRHDGVPDGLELVAPIRIASGGGKL